MSEGEHTLERCDHPLRTEELANSVRNRWFNAFEPANSTGFESIDERGIMSFDQRKGDMIVERFKIPVVFKPKRHRQVSRSICTIGSN